MTTRNVYVTGYFTTTYEESFVSLYYKDKLLKCLGHVVVTLDITFYIFPSFLSTTFFKISLCHVDVTAQIFVD